MKKRILDFIDFDKVNVLLEGFNQSTGFVTAILDLDGNVLSRSGWRHICTDFHRINSETSNRCTISDTLLAGQMKKGEKYHYYKCLNGLIDVAVPIVIKGEHIANLFSGQFLFEKPDINYFSAQADKYGFDKTGYLNALQKVPVISEEKVKSIMAFLLNMTQLISEMTFQRMELISLNDSLRESEETYRVFYESLSDAVFTAEIMENGDPGKLLLVNDSTCKRLGYSKEELLEKTPADILTPSARTYLRGLRSLLYEKKHLVVETEHVAKDGKIIPVELSINIATFKGKIVSHSIARDISERKQAEQEIHEKTEKIEAQNKEYIRVNETLNLINKELQIAKEKAEESDRLKTAFLQNLSHEIRTPMNAILGFSDLLLQYASDPVKLKNFTDIIKLRSNDLLDIINDILDISKIESGQLPVNPEKVSLIEVFSDLNSFFKDFQNRLNKQHLNFRLNQPEADLIITDKTKLKQIIINLISNAFKYTEEGHIEAGCSLSATNELNFYVRDTGVGIPEDKHLFIFDRFTQLNKIRNKNIGGTGLGLSIVMGLSKLLGGKIALESEPGKGSTFYFTLPYVPADLTVQPSANKQLEDTFFFADKKILVVEDDPYNAEFLKEVLINKGVRIFEAENGRDAIEKSLSENADLILMDIRLPDISGYEAIYQIKKQIPGVKIIAQTAYASQDERQKALNAGCIDYISKPLKIDTLLSMIKRHL